jgi:hypothetical protein
VPTTALIDLTEMTLAIQNPLICSDFPMARPGLEPGTLRFQYRSSGPENCAICRPFARRDTLDLPLVSWGFLGVWAGRQASPAQKRKRAHPPPVAFAQAHVGRGQLDAEPFVAMRFGTPTIFFGLAG